jgi:NAD(P)-dependent dehydrogenase (short-subunit alcohol dehydrogenase family)
MTDAPVAPAAVRDMQGKVALVTGAGSGIGRAVATLFAERGASVAVLDANGTAAQETCDLLRDRGGRVVAVTTDVSDESQVRSAIDRIEADLGGLDFAVNNAGIDGDIEPLTEQSLDVFQRVVAVNLTGVFLGLKHEIPALMRRGGGAIVNVSSIAGLRGHPGLGPYVAAKHAVNGLTKTAAIEYGASGIRVNSVCPGGVRTPMLDAYLESAPELRASIIDANPMRRMGEAREMAEAVLWLCSSAASYVNGHELVVDGGRISSDV